MIAKAQVTIIPNKFYYLADTNPPKDIPKAFFFNIDNDLIYEGFFQDFGPLNIAKIWKYINEICKFLHDPKYSENVFYHFTSPHYTKCTNSALLVCAYQIVVLKKTPQQAWKPFQNIDFKPFRDAGYGQCSYKCTILDCLKGLYYSQKLGWFDYKKFDLAEYENYEKLENGDINWIIPNKFIAFSSPYDKTSDSSNQYFTPKDFVPIFKKLGVKTVIRLNNQTYNAQEFKDNGINHYDLYFTDGTCPPKEIVMSFLKIAESEPGAIAVHCKAGLGRTGTLIGCYAIKHFHFNANQFIGWIRLCRPGSVLGPQQYFLLEYEQMFKKDGQTSPIWLSTKQKLDQDDLINQMQKVNLDKYEMTELQKKISVKGEQGQGSKLVDAKNKNKIGVEKQKLKSV